MPRQGENFLLSDTAKTFVQAYENAGKVIFEVPGGSETAFEISRQDSFTDYLFGAPCESDATLSQGVKGTAQFQSFSLSNADEFAPPIVVNLYELPPVESTETQEALTVSFGALFSSTFGNGDELFHYELGESNSEVNFIDSLAIGGKMFYSIYEMKPAAIAPKLQVKYTLKEGIIYIKNPVNAQEFIFKRTE